MNLLRYRTHDIVGHVYVTVIYDVVGPTVGLLGIAVTLRKFQTMLCSCEIFMFYFSIHMEHAQ
jgi:hypothetical protein